MTTQILCHHPEELKVAAKQLLKLCPMPACIAFYGTMGAGKTSLINALCEELGVEEPTGSPTFSIVNEYRCPDGTPVYHFDFYRIKEGTEAMDIGLEEYFEPRAWCFIEWPEKVKDFLPAHHFTLQINPQDDESRIIQFFT